jgi:general secretion pathway protein K
MRTAVVSERHRIMKRVCDRIHHNEQGGVALVLVIWIVVVLIAIVGEFSYSMRTELNITRNFKEEEEAYQLALAGIEQAKMEILSVTEPYYVYLDENETLMFGDPESTEEEIEETDRKGELGRGGFSYTLLDEDGKLNINTATPSQIKQVLLDSGVELEDVDEIVDSIIDWRDPNDLHMLNGAEEDYYQSLDNPYSSKDGPFDLIEELLLVRGMSKEILYGSKGEEEEETSYDGIAQYFSVKKSDRININTASNVVLEAVYGTEAASNILMRKDDGPIMRPINKDRVSSAYFTIISTGISSNDKKNESETESETERDVKIKRSVKAVVEKKDNTINILYWNDNFTG